MMDNLFVAIMASAGSFDEQTFGRVMGIDPWLKLFRLLNKTLHAGSRTIFSFMGNPTMLPHWGRQKVNPT